MPRHSIFVSIIVGFIVFSIPAARATEWEGEPPDSMNELFTNTEISLEKEGYRTSVMEIDEDFFIEDPHEIKLGLNYDSTAPFGERWGSVSVCVARIRFLTLAAVLASNLSDISDPDLDIQEGYAVGYFAVRKPSGKNCTDPDAAFFGLSATGVLFLPGFGIGASALDAARIAAFLSTETDPVFVLEIAHPIQRARNAYTVPIGEDCIGTEYITTLSEYDPCVENASAEEPPMSVGPARNWEDAQIRMSPALMYGFRDPEDIHPDHSLFWSYAMSAQKAVSIFYTYFYPNGWTNGRLFLGGQSFGAEVDLVVGEADPGDSERITGIFTMSAHGSNKDNFIVPGMRQTINVIEANAPQIIQNDLRASVSCDCDRLLSEEMPIVGFRSYCQVPSREPRWMNNMISACRAVKFWSPVNYADGNTSLNVSEYPILMTSGVMDESWSVRGLIETYHDYRDATPEMIYLQLLPDYDHMRYYLGLTLPLPYAGLWNIFSYSYSTNWDLSAEIYPDDTSLENFLYESYMNADYQSPDRLEYALNQEFRTIRAFVHSDPEIINLPPTPFHPDTLLPEPRIEKDTTTLGQTDFVITACFDGSGYPNGDDDDDTSSERVPHLMYGVTLDKFWNVLPACVDEKESDDDTEDGVYAIDSEVNDYNAECYDRTIHQYPNRCSDEVVPDRGLLYGVSNTATEDIENAEGHDGWVCRQVRVRFDESDPPTKDFTAWAEVRDFDETGEEPVYLAAQSTIPTRRKTFDWDAGNFGRDQCIRPTPRNVKMLKDQQYINPDGFHAMDELFADDTPTCTNGYMTVWPTSDDPVPHYVDARGYNVIVEAETEIDVPESVQVIYTDCDITIEAGAEFRENFEENDFEQSSLALIGRNVAIGGTVAADAPGARTISIYGRESVTIANGALVSVASAENDGASHISLAGDGSLTLAGRLDTDAPNAAGAVSAEFRDITVAETAEVSAIADPYNSGSQGGMIFIEAKDTMTVEDEYATPTVSATGDEDGAVGVSFCTGDESPAAIDPPPAVESSRCLIADVDLDDVDWCDGYNGADTCCTPDDPCGYGFDGLCQCADSCEWDVMDCTGAPVGIQVFDSTSENQPVVVGAECVIVDNETGEPVEPEISATSNANGNCWFPTINGAETFSVRVTHDDYLSEYLFNLPTPALPQVYMFPTAEIGDFEEYFEIEIDPEDGIVLGFVLWGGPNGHEPVGCAEVTNDSGQNGVFYADEYGPNPVSTHTSPLNSGFMLFNVPTGGEYEFTATADEEEAYSTVPQVFASSITMTYLVYGGEYETNPTPAECE